FVGANGEDGFVDHGRQHASGDRQVTFDRLARVALRLRLRLAGHRWEAARIEPHHFEFRPPALDLDPVIVERLERDFAAFGLANDFKQLARVQGRAALLVDTAGNLGADADLEVGGRQTQVSAVGLEQHVPEYRHGVAPLHDPLNQRQAALQHRALDYQFHLSSRRRLFYS